MTSKLHHSQATFLRSRNIGFVASEAGIRTIGLTPELDGPAKQIVEQIKAIEKETGKQVRGTMRGDRSGVMARRFHDEYTANGGGNADLLDVTLREELTNEDGEGIDLARLRSMAKHHKVWNERYEALNPGMARMNVANRLRAKIRAGETLDVFGVSISAGDLKAVTRNRKPKAEKKAKPRKAKAEAVEQAAA